MLRHLCLTASWLRLAVLPAAQGLGKFIDCTATGSHPTLTLVHDFFLLLIQLLAFLIGTTGAAYDEAYTVAPETILARQEPRHPPPDAHPHYCKGHNSNCLSLVPASSIRHAAHHSLATASRQSRGVPWEQRCTRVLTAGVRCSCQPRKNAAGGAEHATRHMNAGGEERGSSSTKPVSAQAGTRLTHYKRHIRGWRGWPLTAPEQRAQPAHRAWTARSTRSQRLIGALCPLTAPGRRARPALSPGPLVARRCCCGCCQPGMPSARLRRCPACGSARTHAS